MVEVIFKKAYLSYKKSNQNLKVSQTTFLYAGAVIQNHVQQVTTVNYSNVQITSPHTSYQHRQPQYQQQPHHNMPQQPLYNAQQHPSHLYHHHQPQPQVFTERQTVYHTQPSQMLPPYQSAVSVIQPQPVMQPISYRNINKNKSSGNNLMQNLKLATTVVKVASFLLQQCYIFLCFCLKQPQLENSSNEVFSSKHTTRILFLAKIVLLNNCLEKISCS